MAKKTRKLYHKDIGFTPYIENILNEAQATRHQLFLKYGKHSLNEAQSDPLGPISRLPEYLDCANSEPIEAGIDQHDVLCVVLWRQHYSQHLDLCLVVAPDGFVLTVWLIEKTHHHENLRKNRYTQP